LLWLLLPGNHFHALAAGLNEAGHKHFEPGPGHFVFQRVREYGNPIGIPYPLNNLWQIRPVLSHVTGLAVTHIVLESRVHVFCLTYVDQVLGKMRAADIASA